MKRRTFSIKGLSVKRRPKILEDEAFDPETPKAASKKQVRERNSSDTKKKRSKKVDKQPVETDQLRERENDSESTQDAPPPYTEYDENSSEPSMGREVLISWDDAVRRCVPFSELQVHELDEAHVDSCSTLEDDLIYGTNEVLNQYESLLDCGQMGGAACDDDDTASRRSNMDGSASLPARYLSSISGRKTFSKVNSVQDLRLGSKMYGASNSGPQFYDLHGKGLSLQSRTLTGEGVPQGALRRSLPTSYGSRQPENVLLELDGPRVRNNPHAHAHAAPNRYFSRGFGGGGGGGSSISRRRSPPPREERIANGLRRSAGAGSSPRTRSRYTPAIAVRRDPVPNQTGTASAPAAGSSRTLEPSANLNGISPSNSGQFDAPNATPVGILKRDVGETLDTDMNGGGLAEVETLRTMTDNSKKEKAVVFGAYQPKKPEVTTASRREAKKVAMKNMNVSRAMDAAATGNIVALQHLLQVKVPGIEFTALSRDEDQKATVIHRAAEAGQLDCLKFLMGTLLSHSSTPQDATTLVDIADRTPAMLALQNGHLDCLQYLLQCGNSDLEIDDHGHTLLHHAAYHGQTQCLGYLLDLAKKSGKDLNEYSDDVDVTPAHVAAQQGHIDCLRLLVENEMDICQSDVDGLTPLDWASKANEPLCQHYLTMVEKCWDLTDQLEQAQEKLDRAVREVGPLRDQLDEAQVKKSNLQKTLDVTKAQCDKKIEQNERDCAKALTAFLHLLSPEQQKTMCQQLPTSLLSALSLSQKKLSSDHPLPDKSRSLPRQLDSDPSSPTSSEGDSSDDRSTSSQQSLGADSGCGLDISTALTNGDNKQSREELV